MKCLMSSNRLQQPFNNEHFKINRILYATNVFLSEQKTHRNENTHCLGLVYTTHRTQLYNVFILNSIKLRTDEKK